MDKRRADRLVRFLGGKTRTGGPGSPDRTVWAIQFGFGKYTRCREGWASPVLWSAEMAAATPGGLGAADIAVEAVALDAAAEALPGRIDLLVELTVV